MASEKETPSTQVTVDMAQLTQLIAASVAQVLKSQKDDLNQDGLGESIGNAVAAGMAKHSRPKVSYGQYIQHLHSALHTDPKFPNGPELKREAWFNGARAEQHSLLDAEINLLNRVTRSGRYIDRLVEVSVGLDAVEIRYNDKTNDQRNENAGKWRSITDLLTQVVAAMDAENEEEAAQREEAAEVRAARTKSKERSFGDNKAYREAKALADSKQ